MKKIITVLALSLFLAGCSTNAGLTNQVETNTGTSVTVGDKTPVPTAAIESSGDVEEDFETIETELEALDVDADFQELNESDLSAE